MADSDVILLGYSGHGIVVAEAALVVGLNIAGYADKNQNSDNIFQLKYLGDENDSNSEIWDSSTKFILGVGDNRARDSIVERVLQRNKEVVRVVHPEAMVSVYSTIENGVFVGRGACINPKTVIKKNTIINTGAIIEHHCHIDECAHVAPGAVLSGNVCVGSRTFIGANAVVKQNIIIGKNVVIGAGAVVINNIPDDQTWVGNPAKRIK